MTWWWRLVSRNGSHLVVQALEVIHYPPDGSRWRSIKTRNPDWAAIETAIRRLDRDEWPYLWLHTAEPVEWEMPENALSVMGGRGEYSLALCKDGDELHYMDESRAATTIRIWESDQGAWQPERFLCNDLDRVLFLVQYFTERAELHPDARWVAW
jgi:hypothetical protein